MVESWKIDIATYQCIAATLASQDSNRRFSATKMHTLDQQQGSTPTPWARLCESKSRNGHARDRKPFMHRVFSAQRGIETVVSDHGLRRGQTMGYG